MNSQWRDKPRVRRSMTFERKGDFRCVIIVYEGKFKYKEIGTPAVSGDIPEAAGTRGNSLYGKTSPIY
jgi:hypothetical protein